MIRVDGETFTWMGAPKDVQLANQVAYEYTATKSVFTIEVADKVTVKITFTSPLTPRDFKRQALVFSYMHVEVEALNSTRHDVQVYTDISAGKAFCGRYCAMGRNADEATEWASGDVEAIAQWDAGVVDGIAYHKVWKQNQQVFSENRDRAEWGNIVSSSINCVVVVCANRTSTILQI